MFDDTSHEDDAHDTPSNTSETPQDAMNESSEAPEEASGSSVSGASGASGDSGDPFSDPTDSALPIGQQRGAEGEREDKHDAEREDERQADPAATQPLLVQQEADGANGAHSARSSRASREHSENRVDDSVEIPDTAPILALKDHVVYPFSVSQLSIESESAVKLIEAAIAGNRLIGVVAQKAPEKSDKAEKSGADSVASDASISGASDDLDDADDDQHAPRPDECYRVGVLARIARHSEAPDGSMQVVLQGLDRITLDEFISEEPFLRARVHESPELIPTGLEIEVLKRNVAQLFQRVIDLVQYLPDQLAMAVSTMNDPRQLVYLIAGNLQMELALQQELLELNPVRAKLERLNTFLMGEVEKLEISKKIQAEAQEEMSKAQREYYLREQLKVIQKELGEEGDEAATVSELREKIDEAHMSEEALKEAKRELSRLERLPSAAPEYSVIRTYLETLVALPWDKSTGKPIDIVRAREILNEDHYDLVKIKDRILEYLSVKRLKSDRQSAETTQATEGEVKSARPNHEPILCFVGPPGVGKTSLGQSIAKALGREFVRMSFGGIHDEAEIRGHRRTYIGALPGRILQSLRRAGTNDPVFMLDEVDKLTADWRGDPASALLEVLDPEQNHAFRDNYLDLAFDLSKVMFIATANSLDPIPAPLRDRMEVLELAGYTEEEKLHIARRYLVPKQIKANSLSADEVKLPDETLVAIIRSYTREAGVRGLEREIGTVCRKSARRIAEGGKGLGEVKPDQLRELLGRPRHFSEVAERIDRPGVVTGLVWTPTGGDIIFVEAAQIPNEKGGLTLTGQLGDVMKESATAAYTYVRSNAWQFGIKPRFFEVNQVHIHVPEGGIPKDGPSAGVTMMTAIVSLALDMPVRSDVAMTGEISLRGKVLPIGGLKEKVLAAHRAGIRTVILPKRNEADLEDLTDELRAEMTFVPVDDARDVLKTALEGWAGFRTTMEGLRNTIATTTTGASPNVITQTPGSTPAPMPPSSSNVFPTPPIQRKE